MEPLAFLTSTAKVVDFGDDITDLTKRPEDINFLRFRCVLDGATLDKRVNHTPPLSFHFCLRLPQYLYDVDVKTATPAVSNSIATAHIASGGVSVSS